MGRMTYTPEVKQNILQAAREARAAGRPWTAALAAAQKAGYAGTRGGLCQMILRDNDGDSPVNQRAAGVPAIAAAIDEVVHRRVSSAINLAGRRLEYRSVSLPTQQPPEATLNTLGAEGWELASATPISTALLQDGAQVTRILYVFKRDIPVIKAGKV